MAGRKAGHLFQKKSAPSDLKLIVHAFDSFSLGSDPANPGWTRSYTYNQPSLVEPGKFSNRLSGTQLSGSQALSEQ